MQTGNRNAAVVIEPNDDSAAARVETSMIGAGDTISITAARNDGERLERSSLQMVANVSDHFVCTVTENTPETQDAQNDPNNDSSPLSPFLCDIVVPL